MAITRISQSSVKEGLEKFTSFYGGVSGFVFGNFESIATVTVGSGGAANIEFTSIPGTYQHLQIRMFYKDTAAVNDVIVGMQLNTDAGSNYSRHSLTGTGAAASASGSASATSMLLGYQLGASSSANIFSVAVIDIVDYANTSKNTTVRSLTGADRNGFGEIRLMSGAWFNTSAVTSIKLLTGQTNFAEYSTAALYGVKAP